MTVGNSGDWYDVDINSVVNCRDALDFFLKHSNVSTVYNEIKLTIYLHVLIHFFINLMSR